MFLDEAIIEVRSGRGGNGCMSFRREKYIPRGGPDGGDGGNGGSVYLRASDNITTLLDLGRRRHYIAAKGRPGEGKNRFGRRGEDLLVDVPTGTIVREIVDGVEPQDGPVLGDLTDPNLRLRVASGGKGGRGNKSFATATRQAPRISEEGGPSEEKRLYLELKLLADIGLVGLPNAGKSTLLARVSAATPKIAAYPFTTLQPNLGIAELTDFRRLVIADIPGLIEGAHEGQGLGIEFLRHIERTRVLVHLISGEMPDVDRWVEDYRTIESELSKYSDELAGKDRVIALAKIDLVPQDEIESLVSALSERLEAKVLPFSAVVGTGVAVLLERAARSVRDAREQEAES
jgi:GTP-binding protein